MKKLTIILTITLLVFSVNSQKTTFLKPENIIDYYIGTIDDVDYYSEKDKSTNIFFRFEDYFKKSGELKIGNNEELLEIFIRENNFYSISQKVNDKNELEFILNMFDNELTKIETKTIWKITKVKAKKLNFKFQIKENLIGIVAYSIKKFDKNGYSFVYDMKENKGVSYSFEIKKIIDFKCQDFVFNSKQIDVIFTNKITHIGAFREKYSDVLLVKCSNEKTVIQKLNFNQKKTFCKSIKLCKLNDKDYIIATNLFSKKGPAILGNGFIKAKFGLDETNELTLIFNDKLIDKNLWTKKEFRKLKHKRFFTNSFDQKIVEILLLENENILLISESHSINNNGGFSASNLTSAGNVGTSMSMGISTGVSMSAGGPSSQMEDIILSKINIENKKVIWSTKTQNRLDMPNYGILRYPNSLNFIYSIYDNKIDIYYGKSKNQLGSSPKSIQNFSCDLTTGKTELTPLAIDQKLVLEAPFISSVKKENNKIISFITYEWEKINKYSIDKVRIVEVK